MLSRSARTVSGTIRGSSRSTSAHRPSGVRVEARFFEPGQLGRQLPNLHVELLHFGGLGLRGVRGHRRVRQHGGQLIEDLLASAMPQPRGNPVLRRNLGHRAGFYNRTGVCPSLPGQGLHSDHAPSSRAGREPSPLSRSGS